MAIAFKQVNTASVSPAVHLFAQCIGHIVMADRHKWFDAVSMAFAEYFMIKFQSRRIWLRIVPVWVDSCPRDRQTEHLESHFSQQRNVLFIMMIKINCRMTRIINIFFWQERNSARGHFRATGHKICCTQALTIFQICAF